MSRIQYWLVVAAAACFAMFTPAVASARVHFSIGFGAWLGPCHPIHGWYPGWHWHDPWWYDCWPVIGPSIVVEAPLVVRQRCAVVEETGRPPVRPTSKNATPLPPELQRDRSEQLKILKIGDVASRIRAVQDLARFSSDSSVRAALERALLSDRDAQVRKAVAELFARLKDERTLPALRRAYTEDSSREVRQAAYRAIIIIEGYDGL